MLKFVCGHVQHACDGMALAAIEGTYVEVRDARTSALLPGENAS